jgi:hypothetical protein
MDVAAFVRKTSINTCIMQELVEGKLPLSFILVIDNAVDTGKRLMEILTLSRPFTEVDANELENITTDSRSVFLKDLTVRLLDTVSHTETLRILHQTLLKGGKNLLFDLQEDILPKEIILAVKYLVDICITVLPDDNFHVTRRIPGGKAVVETCRLVDGKFIRVEESAAPPTPTASATPTSTFNLQTTEEQANAKNNVLLPYLRVQLEKTVISKPVLASDHDDEDPDDDLDI